MKRFAMEDSNPSLKSEREHHYDFNYPFPPRHHDWYWRDASMSYDEAIEAFHAQSEEDQHIRRNPVNRDTPKKVVDPNSHDGKGYPFPPRHSMTWQNNEYGVSYDEAVALYEHERAKAVNPRMVRNPLVNVSPKTPDGSRLAVQAMNQELANAEAAMKSVPVVNPDNLYWPPYDFTTGEEYEIILKRELEANHKKAIILTPEDAYDTLVSLWEEDGTDALKTVDKANSWAGHGVAIYKTYELVKQFGDIGVKAAVFESKGKEYIAITTKNNSDRVLRHVLVNGVRLKVNGHKYRTSNPKVIQLGLTPQSRATAAKGGALVTFVLSAAINTNELVFNDEFYLVDWFGNVGVDMFKALIAFGAGEAALILFGAAFSATPVLVGVALAIVVSIIVDEIFEEWAISDKVVGSLKNATVD